MNLKKKIEILGLEIPAVFIALAMIGGLASAATLSYFATIEGTTEVDQAIVFDDSDGEASLSYDFDEVTAGDVTVDTFDIQNNMDEAYGLTYDSEMEADDDNDDNPSRSSYETKIEWDSRVGGITTTYANYFAEAGHDFDEYEVPGTVEEIDLSEETDFDSNTVYEVIDADEEQDITIDEEGVELYSSGQGDVKLGTVSVKAADVVISGFELESVSTNGNAENLVIKHNKFQTEEETQAFRLNNAVNEGTTLYNNLFTGYDHTGTAIISADHGEMEIISNSFEDSWAAIVSANSADVEVTKNRFESDVGVTSQLEEDDSSPIITKNRFDTRTSVFVTEDTEETVEAHGNFFTNGLDTTSGDVEASYQTLDEVPANSEVTLAVVNEFPTMISGEYDYELTTKIS